MHSLEKVVSFSSFCATRLNKPSTELMNWWKQCYRTRSSHCYNQRIFVIICEGKVTSCANVWPDVPSLPWWRNLLTSPLWTVTTMTIITPSHLYPDQPRSKITNKTKPPIVQATPNLLTGVTKPRWPVLCLLICSLTAPASPGPLTWWWPVLCLLICSLTAPASPGTLDTPEIKLDWCQVLWNHNPKSKRLHYTNRQTPPCIDKYSKCKMCLTDFHFRLWVILHLYPSKLRILWCSCF